MLFAIGTKVIFRFTGERGTITAQLGGDMLQVRLQSDPSMEIPAFEEDLVRDTGAEPVLAGAKFVGVGKKEPEPQPVPRREIKGARAIPNPRGILLAFEPMPGRDGSVSRYKAWLVNETFLEFLFDIELFTNNRRVFLIDGKLSASTVLELEDMLYDDLSDHAEIDIEVRRIATDGVEAPIVRRIKIRPKQFFNNLQATSFLNVLAHQFLLLDSFEPQQANKSDSELRDYTDRAIHEKRNAIESNIMPFQAFDVEEFAHFEPEIDLHIENLTNGFARLDKSEIVRIQMQHFQRFLEKAIRLGVPRIFVIHGVGEGKLRDAIAETLRHHPHVHRFKNEYHAKYGYGATEVVFH